MERIVRGFNYENYLRNEQLHMLGFKAQDPHRNGTIVVGFHYADGIMIATDSRMTHNNAISKRGSPRIYRLLDNMYCGGSGLTCDLEKKIEFIRAQLQMHSVVINNQEYSRQVPVVCGKQLIKEALMEQRSKIANSFIIGGVDKSGVHLYVVHHDGTSMMAPLTTIGSGQFAAMGILESRWQPDMDEDDARELIVDAIVTTIDCDLLAGACVELCIIRSDNSTQLCREPICNTLRYIRNLLEKKKTNIVDVGVTNLHKIQVTNEIVIKLPPLVCVKRIQSKVLGPIIPYPLHLSKAKTSLLGKRKRIMNDDEDYHDDEIWPRKRRRLT